MRSVAVLMTVMVCLAYGTTRADDYPSRPIRVIVPNAAGGAADVAARLAAEPLGRILGTPIYVENRRNGLSAVESVLTSAPDGYTILVAAVGLFTITPAAKHVAYDPVRDFIPIGTIWRSNHMLAAGPRFGVRTLREFIDAAKARPGTLSIGSTGVGTPAHLTIELLKREAHIDVIHVPFRGSGESLPALAGGQIDALVGDVQVVLPQLKAGAGHALAVAATRRLAILPDVPTMAEAGLPNVVAESWFGFVVSARTPAAIVKRLQDALSVTHGDPDYVRNLARQRVGTGEPGPEAFSRLIRGDLAKWGKIVTDAGIRLE